MREMYTLTYVLPGMYMMHTIQEMEYSSFSQTPKVKS